MSTPKKSQRRLATETGAVAVERRGFQAGPNMRMPRTRLTATTKYTEPKMGHQRGPARSIQAVRCSHFSVRTAPTILTRLSHCRRLVLLAAQLLLPASPPRCSRPIQARPLLPAPSPRRSHPVRAWPRPQNSRRRWSRRRNQSHPNFFPCRHPRCRHHCPLSHCRRATRSASPCRRPTPGSQSPVRREFF